MVVEYTADGKILRELLTHGVFPFPALDMKSDVVLGGPVMGYSSRAILSF